MSSLRLRKNGKVVDIPLVAAPDPDDPPQNGCCPHCGEGYYIQCQASYIGVWIWWCDICEKHWEVVNG